jgi:hypothetical protein
MTRRYLHFIPAPLSALMDTRVKPAYDDGVKWRLKPR